jgi:ankyrin repeat protein
VCFAYVPTYFACLFSAQVRHHTQTQIVALLLERGADPNERSGLAEYPPLHTAVRAGSLTATRMLLEAGADTRLRCKGHEGSLTPRSTAVKRDALAVEFAQESMDMRPADLILRWEEEHRTRLPFAIGSNASASMMEMARGFVNVYRATGDVTGKKSYK